MKRIWFLVWTLAIIIIVGAVFPSLRKLEHFAGTPAPSKCDHNKLFLTENKVQIHPKYLVDPPSNCWNCSLTFADPTNATMACNCTNTAGACPTTQTSFTNIDLTKAPQKVSAPTH